MNNDQGHFNKYCNKGEPIQTSFNLTIDVLEVETSRATNLKASSSTLPKRPSGQSLSSQKRSDSSRAEGRP